jgi:hypothetical protein
MLCSTRLGRNPPNRHRLLKNQELDHDQHNNGDQENGLHLIPFVLSSGRRLASAARWAFIPRFVPFVNWCPAPTSHRDHYNPSFIDYIYLIMQEIRCRFAFTRLPSCLYLTPGRRVPCSLSPSSSRSPRDGPSDVPVFGLLHHVSLHLAENARKGSPVRVP